MQRQNVFTRTFDKRADTRKSAAWGKFLQQLAQDSGSLILHAQLQSRLMVNMAGGVMENAGLCLDRFGMPYIPGSAVKGCARRAATQALLEAEAAEKVEVLCRLALVFGWGDTDWKAGRKHKHQNGRDVEIEPYSDFWWAMAAETCNRAQDDAKRNQVWSDVAVTVVNHLLDHLRIRKREYPSEPWRDLPNFAGSVAFLPAYLVDLGTIGRVDGLPVEVPALGKLELDIVTCHHRDYYDSDDPAAVATDTEEPNPVVFPAVAPGHVFTFAAHRLRSASADDVQLARTWLQSGLQTFGLGAKTNAGYGWFECSERVESVIKTFEKEAREKRQAQEAQAEIDRKRAEAEKSERERLASAPPAEQSRAEFVKLRDEEFAAQAKKFQEMTDDQRLGFILALRERRETAKRWAKKKPELLKPWQEHAQKQQPPVQLP